MYKAIHRGYPNDLFTWELSHASVLWICLRACVFFTKHVWNTNISMEYLRLLDPGSWVTNLSMWNHDDDSKDWGYITGGDSQEMTRSIMRVSWLVGGFNPSEKYARQIGSFPPSRAENKKSLKPPPRWESKTLTVLHKKENTPTSRRFNLNEMNMFKHIMNSISIGPFVKVPIRASVFTFPRCSGNSLVLNTTSLCGIACDSGFFAFFDPGETTDAKI